jgi:5-hydroxyisourate hydrolase-like protein (transthyretin family)
MGSLASKWLMPCVVAASVAAQQQQDLTVVRGRAIDRDCKPVAKCAVGLFELGESFTTKDLLAKPSATTDDDGRYELRAKKHRFQIVVVTAKDRQVCLQRLRTGASAEHTLPDALMLPGTTLRGRVRDANGKPIAGALVRVDDPLPRSPSVTTWFESQAVSDERGIFEVPGVPRTGMRVTAGARGFPAVSRLAAHDSPLDLTLAATGLVRGRVTADGKPAAGVRVNVATVESREDLEQIKTDSEGRFELTAPNTFRFRVTANDWRGPYGKCWSGLLGGPADDVEVMVEATAPRDGRKVTLRVVDAATKAPIEEFFASWSSQDSSSVTSLVLNRPATHGRYRGEAVFDVVRDERNRTNGSLLVDAPGHGYAIVAVPDDVTAPLIAELPVECVLTGQVIDDATGKPATGAAVRALPYAHIYGGGPDPWKAGATTDENGRYRIGGLAPGDYFVQVYGVGRQASDSRRVTLAPDAATTLDLAVPNPMYLEFEIVGGLPPSSLAAVVFGGVTNSGNSGPSIEGPLPELPPLPPLARLSEQRAYKLGPVGVGDRSVLLQLPARDRLSSAQTIPLGTVTRGKPARLQLPDLRQVLHSGRVFLPPDVPTERVAVVASRGERDGRAFTMFGQPPFAVCVRSDGAFEIDLLPGEYTLQLIDLESKLAFWTEAEARKFDATPAPIAIKPVIRWLHAVLEPTVENGPVVLQAFQIQARCPRDGVPAMLGWRSANNDLQTGGCPFGAGTKELHWLVPETGLRLDAMQAFEALSPGSQGTQGTSVDNVVVEQGTDDVRVKLRIPPPPDDATLAATPKK